MLDALRRLAAGRGKRAGSPAFGPWFLRRDFPATSRSWRIDARLRERAEFAVANAVLSGMRPEDAEIRAIAAAMTTERDDVGFKGCAALGYETVIGTRLPGNGRAVPGTGVEIALLLDDIATGLLVASGKRRDGEGNVIVSERFRLGPEGTLFGVDGQGRRERFANESERPFDGGRFPAMTDRLRDFRDFARTVAGTRFDIADHLGKLFLAIPNARDVWHPWRSMALRIFSRLALEGTGYTLRWQIFTENAWLMRSFGTLRGDVAGIMFGDMLERDD